MYHKVVIIGNLTRDPEMRYTPGGTAVTNLSVATSNKLSKSRFPECPDGWRDGYQGKNWEQTIFWRVTVWRDQAETVNQFLSKGSQVYIEGTVNGIGTDGVLNPRTWTGNDGTVRASFEITARLIKFLSGRGGAGEGEAPMGPAEPPADFVEENDIPF
jgi:single-strand DNA-binding protein